MLQAEIIFDGENKYFEEIKEFQDINTLISYIVTLLPKDIPFGKSVIETELKKHNSFIWNNEDSYIEVECELI